MAKLLRWVLLRLGQHHDLAGTVELDSTQAIAAGGGLENGAVWLTQNGLDSWVKPPPRGLTQVHHAINSLTSRPFIAARIRFTIAATSPTIQYTRTVEYAHPLLTISGPATGSGVGGVPVGELQFSAAGGLTITEVVAPEWITPSPLSVRDTFETPHVGNARPGDTTTVSTTVALPATASTLQVARTVFVQRTGAELTAEPTWAAAGWLYNPVAGQTFTILLIGDGLTTNP